MCGSAVPTSVTCAREWECGGCHSVTGLCAVRKGDGLLPFHVLWGKVVVCYPFNKSLILLVIYFLGNDLFIYFLNWVSCCGLACRYPPSICISGHLAEPTAVTIPLVQTCDFSLGIWTLAECKSEGCVLVWLSVYCWYDFWCSSRCNLLPLLLRQTCWIRSNLLSTGSPMSFSTKWLFSHILAFAGAWGYSPWCGWLGIALLWTSWGSSLPVSPACRRSSEWAVQS